MKRWYAAVLWACGFPALAEVQSHPPIAEIVFEGNAVTRRSVMLRELVVRVGDPADPVALERSRQGLLDLGLFRRVHLRTETVEGGVRVIFSVDERYYVLPMPRGDIKSDGRYAYGAQLRWDNVAGLNHTFRLVAEQENAQRQGIGKETHVFTSYDAPFFADGLYRLGGGVSYTTRPVTGDGGEYTETFRRASVRLSRTFSDGPASQGLTLGTGLAWTRQRTSGAAAPPAYGDALSPTLSVGYRDFHNRIYSEVGQRWSVSTAFAADGWGSDYSFVSLDTAYVGSFAVGTTAHQTLHLLAQTGQYFDGPDGVVQYGLGGASRLRGYDSNFIEGNAYYYVTVEFARPIWKRWLRWVVLAEAGNVFARPQDVGFDRIYGSLGLGLRIRFSHFVDFEAEIGYAIPLDGGSGRIFASRV